MTEAFKDVHVAPKCCIAYAALPKPTRKCLKDAFNDIRAGKLRLYDMPVLPGGPYSTEACGFHIYVSICGGNILIAGLELAL